MTKRSRKRIEPSREMWPVLKELKRRGLWFTVCSPQHLKIDDVNFWPSSGRIFVDGAPKSHPERGLSALIDYLNRMKQKNADTASALEVDTPSEIASPKVTNLEIEIVESDPPWTT